MNNIVTNGIFINAVNELIRKKGGTPEDLHLSENKLNDVLDTDVFKLKIDELADNTNDKIRRTYIIPRQTFTGSRYNNRYLANIEFAEEVEYPEQLIVVFDDTTYNFALNAAGTKYSSNEFKGFEIFITPPSVYGLAISGTHTIMAYIEEEVPASAPTLAINVEMVEDVPTLDKTWKEIKTAISQGCFAFIHMEYSLGYILTTGTSGDDAYNVYVFANLTAQEPTTLTFTCDNEDGYPALT